MTPNGLGRKSHESDAASTAAVLQDTDVGYYVLVPFTSREAAEWATGEIGLAFDCLVVGAEAVDQNAPVLSQVVANDDD